jgi:hypothetical protein
LPKKKLRKGSTEKKRESGAGEAEGSKGEREERRGFL